jgi:hypothetical protein
VTRLVVELAGPAGAGKTTLARAVKEADPGRIAVGVGVGVLGLAAGTMPAVPHLVAARLSAPGRWWTRDELRSLAYLSAWRGKVVAGRGQGLLLLDHGPAFRLASIVAFGPPMRGTRAFDRLWTGLARDWGRLLDVVVWLDAPDEVLLRRIAHREQEHRIRGAAECEAERFLARYRLAYRQTLDRLALEGARVICLDSATSTPPQLAHALRETLLAHPGTRSR